jgi:hypothetical protein
VFGDVNGLSEAVAQFPLGKSHAIAESGRPLGAGVDACGLCPGMCVVDSGKCIVLEMFGSLGTASSKSGMGNLLSWHF